MTNYHNNPHDFIDPHSRVELVATAEVTPRYKALLRRSSEEVLRRSALGRMAMENPVTGLPNRRVYDIIMLDIIAEAERAGGSTDVAVAIIDLDKFKRVNDTMGHEKGDELMRKFGYELQELVRPHDTVVHLGGDEFLVIMPELDQRDDHDEIPRDQLAPRLTERFREAGETAARMSNVPESLGVSASAGIAFYEPGDDPLIFANRADEAMFIDKRSRGVGR